MSDHPIPEAALDQPLCIVGTVGSGKTYAAKSAVEFLLRAGRRVVIVDPTGVWHGLRSMADGSPGFPIIIFGGEQADVPVEPDGGAILGDLLTSDRVTQAIVDVSDMTGGERTRFLTAMLERLYVGARVPRHLVLDEADEMASQNPLPEQLRLLGIVDKIVRRGRVRGFRPMMITQRPAVLHKNVLSQIATLVAMRLTSPQDRKAVEGWVKGSADLDEAKAVLTSLPKLEIGEGWVWAPREGVLERRHFPAIATLDTSATPDNADAPDRKRAMATVDVAALREAMSQSSGSVDEARDKSVAKPAGQPNPRNGASCQPAERPASAAEIAAAEQRGFTKGEEQGLRRGAAAGWTAAIGIVGLELGSFASLLPASPCEHEMGEEQVANALGLLAWPAAPPASPPTNTRPRAARASAPASAKASSPAPTANGTIGAERRPLAALARAHPAGMTEAQWAVAAGMKRSGGTWSTYKSRLRAAGAIEAHSGQWFATASGLEMVGGSVEPMPEPGPKLVEFWIGRIASVGPMLRALAKRYPRGFSRADLASAIGMAASGGSFSTYLSRLRSAGLIEQTGSEIRAAPALMEARHG